MYYAVCLPTGKEAVIEQQIVISLRRIMRAVDRHSRRLLEEFGLTGPQLAVLTEAARVPGSPATVLARGVHLSRPTVTGILDRLEKRGLVQRAPGSRDRRSIAVSVTPAGEKVLAVAPSLLTGRFRRELAALAEWERTQILATLQRIAAMMDAEDVDAAPVLMTGPVHPETDQPPLPPHRTPRLPGEPGARDGSGGIPRSGSGPQGGRFGERN